MPDTSKPPTPQGISALLARAGLPRSTRIGGRYGAPLVSEGFSVRASTYQAPAVADVRYRTGNEQALPDEAASQRQREMLSRCADVIRAAGWPVRDRQHKLVVDKPGAVDA